MQTQPNVQGSATAVAADAALNHVRLLYRAAGHLVYVGVLDQDTAEHALIAFMCLLTSFAGPSLCCPFDLRL